MSHNNVTDTTDMARFRELQHLAYSAAQSVASTLEPGVTEGAAAHRIRAWLEERGIQDWFHISFRGVGVKFEEILVAAEDDMYWLDDDLPHVRRWKGVLAA